MQRSYPADLERGSQNPSVRTLVKIANALDVETAVLLLECMRSAGAQDDRIQRIDSERVLHGVTALPLMQSFPGPFGTGKSSSLAVLPCDIN